MNVVRDVGGEEQKNILLDLLLEPAAWASNIVWCFRETGYR